MVKGICSKFNALHCDVQSSRGFSLIEVAIALMLVSLILIPILHLMEQRSKAAAHKNNLSKLNGIESFVNQFQNLNGFYPLPASPGLAPGDPNYGRSVSIAGIPNCAVGITQACRADRDGSAATTEDRVLIGVVPFVALGITDRDALDENGMKLMYAVSEHQTTAATFTSFGSIIVNNQTNSVNTTGAIPGNTAPMNIAHFLIASFGRDYGGAFTREGVLLEPCGATNLEMDNENCNNDTVFRLIQDVIDTGAFADSGGTILSLNPGADYFDDRLQVSTGSSTSNWQISPDGGDMMSNRGLANIAIGLPSNEVPYAKVDVNGSVKGQSVSTEDICRYTANSNRIAAVNPDCVPLRDFTEDPVKDALDPSIVSKGIECTSGSGFNGMRRVGSGPGSSMQAICTPNKLHASESIGSCATGTYPTGMINGILNCVPL